MDRSLVGANHWKRVGLKVLWVIPFLAVLGLGVAALVAPLGAYDESASLLFASFVYHGRVPGADFSAVYPPLMFYLDAASFSVLGETAVAPRLLKLGFYLLALAFAARFFGKYFGQYPLLVHAALLILAGSFAMPLKVAAANTIAVTVTALLLLWEACIHKRGVLGLGVLTGFLCMCRINFGAYLGAAIAGGILLEGLSVSIDRRNIRLFVQFLGPVAIFISTILVVALGGFALLSRGALAEVFQQTVIEPQQFLSGYRFISIPRRNIVRAAVTATMVLIPPVWFLMRGLLGRGLTISKILWLVVAGTAIFVLTFANAHNPAVARYVASAEVLVIAVLHLLVLRLSQVELSFLLFWAAELHYAFTRLEPQHIAPLVPVLALLVPVFVFTTNKYDVRANLSQAAGVLVLCGGGLLTQTVAPDPAWLHLREDVSRGLTLIFSGELTERISDAERVTRDRSLTPAWQGIFQDLKELASVKLVRSHTGPKDPVFAGVIDHSTAIGNCLRVYWLLQRPVPVRNFVLDPGITTEQRVQARMIADLKRNNVQWVILETEPLWLENDNKFLKQLQGSHLLDDYIRRNFRPVANFDNYLVLSSR